MQQQREQILVRILWLYIAMIIVKDYFIDLFIYIKNDEVKNAYIQMKSAMFQAFLLVFAGILFCYFIYEQRKEEGEYKTEKIKVDFLKVIQNQFLSIKEGFICAVLGVVCFFAFNIAKNAYIMVKYYFTSEMAVTYIDGNIELGFFLVLVLVLGFWIVLGEELVYRRVLFYHFSEIKSAKGGFIFSTVIFVTAHASVEQMIQALCVAIVLNVLFLRTKSVTSCVILHVVYNVLGLTVTYYFPLKLFEIFGVTYNLTKEDILISILCMLIVFILLCMIAVVLIVKLRKDNNEISLKPEIQNGEKRLSFFIPVSLLCVYSAFKIISAISML